MDTLLEVTDLCAWYGRAQILFDLDLTVGRGEAVALVGRNGAGKSTTLKSIMGLIERVSGAVRFGGQDLRSLEPYQIARSGLGYVPEERRVFTDLSVMENLEVGRQPARSNAATWSPEKLFEVFPNLGEMRSRPGGKMSGGEQQMLTVARTLMGNPYLVLLDEPSEGIAPKIVEDMAVMLRALKAQGIGMLLSEQNLHFAQSVCDRAYVIEKGQVRFEGAMRELMQNEGVKGAYLAV